MPIPPTPSARSRAECSTRAPAVSTLYKRWQRGVFPQLLALSALGCASEAPLALAPLGSHQVQVGELWQLQLRAEGGEPPLQWRVIRGPAQAWPAAAGARCWLVWSPGVFDLAPTKPGAARAAGSVQPLAVEVRDARGASASAQGWLQALSKAPP